MWYDELHCRTRRGTPGPEYEEENRYVASGYLLHMLPGRADAAAQRIVTCAPLVLQVLMAAAMIWFVMQIKSSDIQPFIYFQF